MTKDPLADVMTQAQAIQARAHAPYSKFKVGAAVRASGGGPVFAGANIENASYGLCVCAERNAVFAAVLAGHATIDQVAVYTDAAPPSSPCGACRQVLAEFADPAGVAIVAFNRDGMRREWTLAQLLPDAFTGKELP
jgi:cytidine deaminase